MKKYRYQFIGFFSGFILAAIICMTVVAERYDNPIEIILISFLTLFFLTSTGNLIGKTIDVHRYWRGGNKND